MERPYTMNVDGIAIAVTLDTHSMTQMYSVSEDAILYFETEFGPMYASPMDDRYSALLLLAGIDASKIDYAVPLSWQNTFGRFASMRAIWLYEDESLMGRPVLLQEIKARAIARISMQMNPEEVYSHYESEEKVWVQYSTNNSGGYYWLSKKDWLALESAGWIVDKNDIFMGVYHKAYRQARSIHHAVTEFANVTGQDPHAEGCNCCGQPHYFNVVSEKDMENSLAYTANNPGIVERAYPND